MPKVRVLTHGKIWANRTTREILWAVMKYKKLAVGILHIESANVTGDILVHNGIFVVGGKLSDGKTTGYDAIRSLLMVKDGKFEYVDYSEVDCEEFDNGLKIRLTQLINKLPNLPPKLDELMGANTLNRMRSLESLDTPPSEEQMIDKETFAQLTKWESQSMRYRAAAFWGAFIAISGLAAFMYFTH